MKREGQARTSPDGVAGCWNCGVVCAAPAAIFVYPRSFCGGDCHAAYVARVGADRRVSRYRFAALSLLVAVMWLPADGHISHKGLQVERAQPKLFFSIDQAEFASFAFGRYLPQAPHPIAGHLVSPTELMPYYNAALVLEQKGSYQEAFFLLYALTGLQPQESDYYAELGRTYARMQEPILALYSLRESLAHAPHQLAAAIDLLAAYWKLGLVSLYEDQKAVLLQEGSHGLSEDQLALRVRSIEETEPVLLVPTLASMYARDSEHCAQETRTFVQAIDLDYARSSNLAVKRAEEILVEYPYCRDLAAELARVHFARQDVDLAIRNLLLAHFSGKKDRELLNNVSVAFFAKNHFLMAKEFMLRAQEAGYAVSADYRHALYERVNQFAVAH